MKNKMFIILILLTSTFLSCQDELFQVPQTSKVLSAFLRNEIEVEEYVNATYGALQSTGLYGLYLPAMLELPSDNTFDEVPANDNGNYGQLDDFSVIPSNDIVERVWQDSYSAIQRTNVVLNRITDVTYKNDATKQSRIGEMEFIRALLYFNLVRIYGAVPLVSEETVDPNKFFGQGRTPSSQVYDQIKIDLMDAIAKLPDTQTQAGRVARTAAQTLLAKVYLTLKDYSNAKQLLTSVIGSGKHLLLPKTSDVFSITNENNKEIIFAVQFASGINGNTEGSTMYQWFSPSGTVSGAKGHNLPTKDLYALYASADSRKGVYVGVTSAGTPYTNKLTKPTTVITDGGSDFVVLRYADVLLMMAEVENELNNTSSAINYLNQVRTRAGLANSVASSQIDVRDAVAIERRLELIGEGHRWFDLLRTNSALTVMNKWFKDNNKLTTIDNHNLIMPIPQSQINTDPAIKQNTGY